MGLAFGNLQKAVVEAGPIRIDGWRAGAMQERREKSPPQTYVPGALLLFPFS